MCIRDSFRGMKMVIQAMWPHKNALLAVMSTKCYPFSYFERPRGAHRGGFGTQVRSGGTKDPRPYLCFSLGKLKIPWFEHFRGMKMAIHGMWPQMKAFLAVMSSKYNVLYYFESTRRAHKGGFGTQEGSTVPMDPPGKWHFSKGTQWFWVQNS